MEITNPNIFFIVSIILKLLVACKADEKLVLPIIVDDSTNSTSSTQTYIIHVHRPDNDHRLLVDWHLSFLSNPVLSSGEPRLLHSYRHVISGFAARLTRDELRAVESTEGFVSAYPDRRLGLHTTYTPDFLELNSWNGLWKSSSYGEGVIVAVLDTGVTPDHASFADSGMPPPPAKWRGCCQFKATCGKSGPRLPCNNKLIGAMNFAIFGSSTPIDELGHGTHTAGTAVGSTVDDASVLGQARGTAVGMAPRAHLAVYKVCHKTWDDKTKCDDSSVLAGIDGAIDDGVDVLSISLGTSDKMYKDSIAKGTFAAMEMGIIACACAGNEGYKLNDISNDAPWILTVGASSTDRVARAVVRLGNGAEFDGESAYQPGPDEYTPTMMPVEYPGLIESTVKKTCQKGALDDLDVKGKVVLCGVGYNKPAEKGEVVKAAGGAALILLNQEWNSFTIQSDPHVIPAARLNHVDTLAVLDYFKTTTNPTAMIIFHGTRFRARKAPAVAAFSSRGPSLTNGGILKPDIVGPGVDILAAWHKAVGPKPSPSTSPPFNFASGCSMATPHLAGVAALLKGSHPDWSPAAIKSAIMTTAHIRDRDGDPITDEKPIPQGPASLFAMGAGHVNPPKADDPGLIYDTKADDYVGYLCGIGYSDFNVFAVTRRRIQCSQVKKIKPEDLNYPSISVALERSSTNDHSSKTVTRMVTNVADIYGKEEYRVEVDEPEGAEVEVSPEKLKFSRRGQEKSYEVKIKAKKQTPGKGEYSEGYLTWVSGKHRVRSPISVKF